MPLPSRINPCPIVDALLEVRFSSNLPPSAVYGVAYNAVKDNYPRSEDLPILQIPEPIRKVDPNFRFKPLFKALNDKFVMQFGPDVFTISSHPTYSGWTDYSVEILRIFDVISKLGLIKSVFRVGYHVVNFFEENIYPKTKLDISIGGKKIDYTDTLLKNTSDDVENKIRTVIQVSNEARFNTKSGSIIDIDSYTTGPSMSFNDVSEKLINTLHHSEKAAFFSLLSDEYVKTLSPEF